VREHDSYGSAVRRGRRKFDDDDSDFLKWERLEPLLEEQADRPDDGDR
jgi:RIO kinase 1